MNNSTIYGPDGKTLIEAFVDNGDSTALHTIYNSDGTVKSTAIIAWDSTPPPPPTITVPSTVVEDLQTAMSDPQVNTIDDIKSAIRDFAGNLLGK